VPSTPTSARGFNAAVTWYGTYTCNQGLTGLTSTVSDYEMVDLTATAPAGDSSSMDGEIHGYNCTTVRLRRVIV
jgi:hypothetical protein